MDRAGYADGVLRIYRAGCLSLTVESVKAAAQWRIVEDTNGGFRWRRITPEDNARLARLRAAA